MTTNERKIKTAAEIKGWMDKNLHELEGMEEYSFPPPIKREGSDNVNPNWTFAIPILHQSNVPMSTMNAATHAAFIRIWANASAMFNLE